MTMVIATFAGFGALLVTRSFAATPTVSQEAESGVQAGNLATTSGASATGASGGSAVRFGAVTAGSDSKPTVVGRQLQKGATGQRLVMDGVAVWGIQDYITTGFGASEYANRQTIVNTVKAWGGNHIRLRLLASDYNKQTYMSKAQYIQQVKDWRDAAVAAGLYFQPTWWDSLDGDYSKGNWASQYNQAFQMMADVHNALGNDPMVYYEPFNEPTDAPSSAQWLTAMKATAQHFRNNLGYTGILLIDMRVWSHEYNDSAMTQLEQYDATLNGMNGKPQIIFAKHDYANEYDNPNTFSASAWASNGGNWDFSKHLVWETEFGNYNGDPSTVHLSWSQGAATGLAGKVNDGTLAGATAFVFGPWYDANAMTSGGDTNPTTWGGYVKNNFLGSVN